MRLQELLLLVAVALVVPSCTCGVRPTVTGKPVTDASACSQCHGSEQTPAPPNDLLGTSDPNNRGVGAHESHVVNTHLRAPLPCESCHVVPKTRDEPGHMDGPYPAVVTFAGLSLAHGATPTAVQPSTGNARADQQLEVSCTGAYCHGATLSGGAVTTQLWNRPDPRWTACDACHGFPPPAPHVASDACGSCHPAAYSKTGATTGTVDLALHIDGNLDVGSLTCTSCHGTAGRTGTDANVAAAPPSGTHGETATSARAVGAHLSHLQPGPLSEGVACSECHTVPGSTSHSNGAVELSFGPLARTSSAAPAWNGSTCAGSYCHGNFKNGNAANTPGWTAANQAPCGSCHGDASNPAPGGTHPRVAADSCGRCHPDYTGTSVAKGLHVDGIVEVINLTCTTCHGDETRAGVTGADPNQKAAPPLDTAQSSASTALGVGAHQAHLNPGAGAVAKPFACVSCHPVPSSTSHASGTVDVVFGTLAKSQASTPTWTRASATCTSAWCHGGNAKLAGGNKTSVVWNNNTVVDCTSCHGNPPPAPHVQNNACARCHPGYSKTGATTGTVNLNTHVNGVIDTVALTCTTCHGTAGRTGADPNIAAAPPSGTAGETLNTTRAVGGHLAHLTGSALSSAVACSQCHVVPATNLHANGAATVTFGTLARTGAVTPAWNGTTCASSYCHGNFRNGNAANAPIWASGAPVVCGSCHGVAGDPTPGGTHPAVAPAVSCGTCHPGYTRTTVVASTHVNGAIEGGEPGSAGTSCGLCHSAQFAGMTGGVAKVSKHTLAGGDNPVDPGGAWSTAASLKAAPLYANASCVDMCHGDHPHDTTSPAVATHQNNVHLDADTRSAARTNATRSGTDFDAVAAKGGLCLSCHRTPVDATHPAIDKAAFTASAHNYTANAQGTWAYALHDGSSFARNCGKCHSDRSDARPSASATPFGAVHYSDFPSLLAGATNPAGAPANFVCYNCHGNATTGANLSGKDLATELAQPQAHPVNADSKHNSAAEAAPTWNNGLFSGANRHVNCLDCHDPHKAGAVSFNYAATATATRNLIPANSALTGASGVGLTTNPSLWTATGAGNFTFLPAATAEYQVCFTCHTSFAFGATPPTGVSGQVETDLAMEFNPNNRSGHPVVTGLSSYGGSPAPRPLAAAQLLAPWNTNVGTQTMLCSDCHNADAAAPAVQGPHGSAATFMLSGANRTWPGTFTLTGWNAGLGTAAGLFCANCHPMNAGGWTNNVHSRGNHQNRRCTACHIVIPHGGKVSRLIATNTAGLPAAYQQTGVTVLVTQFKKASSRTNYNNGGANCQTSCGGHGNVTAAETW